MYRIDEREKSNHGLATSMENGTNIIKRVGSASISSSHCHRTRHLCTCNQAYDGLFIALSAFSCFLRHEHRRLLSSPSTASHIRTNSPLALSPITVRKCVQAILHILPMLCCFYAPHNPEIGEGKGRRKIDMPTANLCGWFYSLPF